MPLIIDGHNLIGALPDVDLADPDDEARLIGRLQAYRARSGQSMIVFFDSGDPLTRRHYAGESPGGDLQPPGPERAAAPRRYPTLSVASVQVVFAGPGQTADDAIVAYLRSRIEPGQFAVVTNDQELAGRARRAGANVIPASDFARRLARPQRRPAPSKDTGAPDPRSPAYADLFTEFLHPGAEEYRFGADLRASPELWIERLYGEDVAQAQLAARWLGRYGAARALEPLRDALTDGDARLRASAALALGDLHNMAALPDLVRRLSGDEAGMVREAAAQSLGRIGNRDVEAALATAAAADPKAKVRKAAQAALVQVRARRTPTDAAG
jgi:predicted RNA-binding protein with PIN domain